MTDHLFVYGTLRRQAPPIGWPNFSRKAAEYVGEGTAVGLLYDLGRFPGMIEVSSPHAPREHLPTRSVRATTVGDVYLLKDVDKTPGELDRYESRGIPPALLIRTRANGSHTDGRSHHPGSNLLVPRRSKRNATHRVRRLFHSFLATYCENSFTSSSNTEMKRARCCR